MIRIYLVRHGRQCSKLCNVDVSLDDAGRRQAGLAGKRLAAYGIKEIYSSDYKRAVETAEIINGHIGVKHHIRTGLREIFFGELEGLSDEEIRDKYKDFLMRMRKAEEDIPYPGGECGMDVYKRAWPVIEEIVDKGIKENIRSVAVITHGTVIRSLVAGVLQADMSKKLCVAKDLENCGITEIDYDENTGNYIVERVNDYAHIESEPELMRKYFKRSL